MSQPDQPSIPANIPKPRNRAPSVAPSVAPAVPPAEPANPAASIPANVPKPRNRAPSVAPTESAATADSMPVPAMAPLPKTRLPEPPKPPQPVAGAEAEPAPETTETAKKGGLVKKLVWLVPLGLMPVGYFGSKLLTAAPAPTGHETEHAHHPTTIDESILDGQFESALKRIRTGHTDLSSDGRAALQFREALCLEALGKPAEAVEAYATLAAAAPDTPRGVAARLGQIRSLRQAGRGADAHRAVAALILRTGRSAQDADLIAEILVAKADLELALVPEPPKPHPFQPTGLAAGPRRPNYEHYLRWAGHLPEEHGHKPTKGDAHGHDAHSHGHGHAAPTKDDHHAAPADKHDHAAPKKADHPTKAPDAHHDHPPANPDHAAPKKDDHARPPEKHDPHAVAFLDDHHAEAKPEPKAPAGHLTLGPGAHLLERPVSGRAVATEVPAAIAEVAAAAGLRVRTDAGVGERLAGRVADVQLHEVWLADVLDALTDPYDVAWKVEAQTLVLSIEQTDSARQRDRVRRTAAMALAAAPEHIWRPGVMIALGNLDFADGKWKAAGEWYARVLADMPNRPAAAQAAYNLGLTHLRTGDRAKAREQFMGVVDRDPGGKWAGLAYWWIGRSHLDADEPAAAIKAFEQAIAAAPTAASGPAAALGTCLANFRQGEYADGLAALKPFKARLREPDLKPTAALLDSYGRYRLAERPKRTGESEDLLYAVMNVSDESLLGPAQTYFLGLACREFAFGPRMRTLFEKAVPEFRGPLAVRMVSHLADDYLEAGDRAKAREWLLVAAAADRGTVGQKARMHLAEMALAMGRPADALGYAREALIDGADKAQALRLMGQAYEGRKDFARAAKCFAGEVP
jgi:tetratricopeptide (TPR) repeat protein